MLTAQKHKELLGCLTNTTRKVYDSVPKNTSWSVKQITTDVYTQTGARNDIRVSHKENQKRRIQRGQVS